MPVLFFTFLIYAVLGLGSMATMSIGAALLALVLVVFYGRRVEWRELTSSKEVRAYLAICLGLTLAIIASLVGAYVAPHSYAGRHVEVHFWRDLAKLWFLLWPVLLLGGWKLLQPGQEKRVLKAWWCSLGLLGAMGVAQYFSGWPRVQPIPGLEGRYHSSLFFGHHLSTASILIFPFFTLLDSLNHRKHRPFGVALILAILLLSALTLFFTYSRMLWISLPVGIGLWIVMSLQRKVALAILGAGAVLGVAIALQPSIQGRLNASLGVGDRVEIWRANVDFFKSSPLIGMGWRKTQELSGYYLMQKYPDRKQVFSGHAHNNLIEMLAGTGLVGAFFWLLLNGYIFWFLVRMIRRRRPFAKGLLCAWVVFHLNGLTQVNFWESKVLHQMTWAIGLMFFWGLRGQTANRN